MLHNLPPLPPIKGGEGEESKFPRAASASKYIQATNDEGNYLQILRFICMFLKNFVCHDSC